MITDGNKATFAAQVCESMAILYLGKIEDYLPVGYDVENDKMFSHFNPESPEEYQEETTYEWDAGRLRRDAIEALGNIMAKNGADYSLIRNLLENQQKNPWSNPSKVLKYFLLQQHDSNQSPDGSYYLGGSRFRDIATGAEEYLGRVRKFPKSVAMYKAFTAITLNTVRIDEVIFPDETICIVQRALDRGRLLRAYPQIYSNKNTGDRIDGIRDDIAASTFIGERTGSHDEFIEKNSSVIHKIRMPFSRIFATYFMSPELCCDYDTPIIQQSGNPEYVRKKYKNEREVLCDCSHIEAELIFP
jgi:hypothetical protein